jgi:AcrR family transcriptional regulator
MSIRHRMVKQNEPESLTRQDWIDRGLLLLGNSGVEAVRVEPLAKLLGVTKGSFYWHFKNREDLLMALLQAWIDLETDGIIAQVDALEGDGHQKLLALFELAVQDYGQVETAIRAWATIDVKIAAVVAQVDRRRLDYTRDMFLQIGFTPFEAIVRARLVYYALIGEFMIGTERDLADRLAGIRHQYEILTQRF